MALYSFVLLVALCALTGHVTSDFSAVTPNIASQDFTLQGNGTIAPTGFEITLGAPQTASVIYHNTAQNVLDGFTTTMIISITQCDTIFWAQGADGFAFFVASEINTVEGTDYGGSLGLSYKTNIAYIGFDLFLQQIKYNTTGLGVSVLSSMPPNVYDVPELSAWRCTGYPITTTIDYTPPSTFRITASRPTAVSPALTDVTLDLDITQSFTPGSQLYVALSGATGDGFMRQEVISWEFMSKVNIVPYVDCFETVSAGQYRAHMGYRNMGSSAAYLDIGPMNTFIPSPADRGQVKNFLPSRSKFYPLNPFSFVWDGSFVTWNLTKNFVAFDASLASLQCPINITMFVQFTTARNLTDPELNTIVQSIANFMGISVTRVKLVAFQLLNLAKRATQSGELSELELEIGAAGPDTPNEPTAAEAVRDFVENAANQTAINQALDPNGDLGVDYLGTNSKGTGVDGTGQLVDPPVPLSPTSQPVEAPLATPVAASVPTSTPRQAPTAASTASSRSAAILCGTLALLGMAL